MIQKRRMVVRQACPFLQALVIWMMMMVMRLGHVDVVVGPEERRRLGK